MIMNVMILVSILPAGNLVVNHQAISIQNIYHNVPIKSALR